MIKAIVLLSVFSLNVWTQTTINGGRTVLGPLDASNATSTKPIKVGTTLPTACALGDAYFKSDSTPGQNLYFCTTAGNPGTWTLSSGSGGMPVLTAARDANDSTKLNIGCTSYPCSVRWGNTVYSFSEGAVATLTSGTGTAYVYVASDGALTVGHNVTMASCTGCTATGSVTAFPADSIPLYTWAVADGAFAATGTDYRAFLSSKKIIAGTGLIATEANGHTTLSSTGGTEIYNIPVGICSTDGSALAGSQWVSSDRNNPGSCANEGTNGPMLTFAQSTTRVIATSLIIPATVSQVKIILWLREGDGNGASAALNVALACPTDSTFAPTYGTPDVATWTNMTAGTFYPKEVTLTVPSACATGGPKRMYLGIGGRATVSSDLAGAVNIYFVRLEVTP